MEPMRFARPAGVALLLAGALVVSTLATTAAPAAAHGVGGAQPTNARSRVLHITPAVTGVSFSIVQNGRKVKLTNQSDAQVIVSGYSGEPYLRVGPGGVFQNSRSPAVFLNRTLNPPAKVPARYDASAAPVWHRLSGGSSATWHDHRAHSMSPGAFAHSTWSIPLTVAGRPVLVAGDLTWVKAPPWWPWLVLTFVLALLIVLAAWRAWRLTVMLVLVALTWGECMHVLGSWTDASPTLPGRFGAQLISFAAIAIGVFALNRVSRADEPDAVAPYVLVAAVVFIVAGGVGDVATWFRSQLPSALTPPIVRALVALALGGGAGLAVAAAMRLAPASRAVRATPSTPSTPTGADIPG
jgi:hypothetical protein